MRFCRRSRGSRCCRWRPTPAANTCPAWLLAMEASAGSRVGLLFASTVVVDSSPEVQIRHRVQIPRPDKAGTALKKNRHPIVTNDSGPPSGTTPEAASDPARSNPAHSDPARSNPARHDEFNHEDHDMGHRVADSPIHQSPVHQFVSYWRPMLIVLFVALLILLTGKAKADDRVHRDTDTRWRVPAIVDGQPLECPKSALSLG